MAIVPEELRKRIYYLKAQHLSYFWLKTDIPDALDRIRHCKDSDLFLVECIAQAGKARAFGAFIEKYKKKLRDERKLFFEVSFAQPTAIRFCVFKKDFLELINSADFWEVADRFGYMLVAF